MKKLRETVGDTFGIPKDIALDMPHIVLFGNRELQIENYKSLISCESSEITVGGRDFSVVIYGKNMKIRSMRREEILIDGEFLRLEYKIS
ncbi:MAG: YabP/YqfC family sporulation protein [Clostridia bacterium]|nr:YabP/YqfC family sporulation protein [Clostridia bacterium]